MDANPTGATSPAHLGPPGPPGSPTPARAPRPRLTLDAHRLVIALHRAGVPIPTLAKRFPHVVNGLASRWDAPIEVLDAFDGDLLADRRGGRRGFPADALAELLLLRRHAMRRAKARLGDRPPHAGDGPGPDGPARGPSTGASAA